MTWESVTWVGDLGMVTWGLVNGLLTLGFGDLGLVTWGLVTLGVGDLGFGDLGFLTWS